MTVLKAVLPQSVEVHRESKVMLFAQPDLRMIVYPSWARSFSFTWDHLPEILTSPMESGLIDVDTRDAIRSGFLADNCGEWKLVPGGLGNGIIMHKRVPKQSWLGSCLFFGESETHTVRGLRLKESAGVVCVAVMVLRGDMGLRFWGEGKRKPREFECGATIEHVDEAQDEIYWVADVKVGREVPDSSPLEAAAMMFPLKVERISNPPEKLQLATDPWFSDPKKRQYWWRIHSEERGAGLHLAMAAYCAFAWNEPMKGKVFSIHVIAQVEGKPRSRPLWGTWPS